MADTPSRGMEFQCELGPEIADHSEDLEPIIDPIVSPHLPWNKPGADPNDRDYSVLVLPSPAKLESGDPEAEKAFEDFIGLMGRLH